MRQWVCLLGSLAMVRAMDYSSGRSATPAADSSYGSQWGASGKAAEPAPQAIPVGITFARQCSSCHGEEGRGDGRVARMLKPRPPDFEDPAGVSKLSDDELAGIIMNGRGSMPAFRGILSSEVIVALVSYVRDLSGGGVKR